MNIKRISRILIVDDHTIVRTGIEFLLKKVIPSVEVFHSKTFNEVLLALRKDDFDLIILDIDIPGGNNVGMIETIRYKRSGIPILIFTGYNERIYGIPYLQAGASGFLSKDAAEEELSAAIFCIERGRRYVSPDLQQLMVESVVNNEGTVNGTISRLSPREVEVANLLTKGYGTAEISQMLHLQISTVSTFKSRIFAKMGVKNLVELIEKMKLVV